MKAFKVIVVSVFCLLTLSTWPGTCNYLNDYGEDFDFECQSGECLSYILTSLVTNTTLNLADLQWELSCQKIESYGKQFCEDYSAINDGSDLILFQCPANAYIAGLNSDFIGNDTFSDRVWDVKCCRTLGLCTRNCGLVELAYYVENRLPGHVFSGLFSTYDGTLTYPRKYLFEICTLEDCGSPKLLKYIQHPWSK